MFTYTNNKLKIRLLVTLIILVAFVSFFYMIIEYLALEKRFSSNWAVLFLSKNISFSKTNMSKNIKFNITTRTRNISFSTTINNCDKMQNSNLTQILMNNIVLLRPQQIGRLGNKLFSWSAVWGLSKQLQKAVGSILCIRPVIWQEAELYQLFGDKLDAFVTDKHTLDCFKSETIRESHPFLDQTIFERIFQQIRLGSRGVRVFAVESYTQSWRYFHSTPGSNEIDAFELYRQFEFPQPIFKFANKLIENIKQKVEYQYNRTLNLQINFQLQSPAYSGQSKIQLNQTTIMSFNFLSKPIITYVAVHMRFTDYIKTMNIRLLNREYFVLAAAAFFAHSKNVMLFY